jgi:hypothetical protein
MTKIFRSCYPLIFICFHVFLNVLFNLIAMVITLKFMNYKVVTVLMFGVYYINLIFIIFLLVKHL